MIDYEVKCLVAIIERPDGSTYEQQYKFKGDEDKAIKNLQKMLGRSYKVVDWFIITLEA